MRNPARLCVSGILTALLLLTGGCTQVNSALKTSKNFYYTHINKPAELNMESGSEIGDAERTLARRVMTIDEELSRLEKALDALAAPPDEQGAQQLLRRFPWLSGLAMVAPDGVLGASIPPVPLKQLSYLPLLETAPKALPRDLRACVQDTPLGPEILLARPFLHADQLQVLLVASFDFRALLPFAGSPSDLVVRSADVLIWSGGLDYASSPMADVNWRELLRKQSYGTLENNSTAIRWATRYIGGRPLIFAAFVQ